MANLFGGGASSKKTPPASTMRVQTAFDGKARAIFWGTVRVSTNLVWYGDFASSSVGGGGGKGVGGGGGGKGSAGGSYVYQAAVICMLGEGPITGIGKVWNSKSLSTLADLNLGIFTGTPDQSPWSYLTTLHPDEALAYRRSAYLAAGPMQLGNSPELPQLSFEVIAAYANAAPGIPDANFAGILGDVLGNPIYGIPGWSSAFNGDWTQARAYMAAAGLWTSIALTDRVGAGQWLAEVIASLNLDAVWSDRVLKLVPRGDQAITAGAITATTETHAVSDDTTLPPRFVSVGDAATFVADQGVTFQATGVPLVRVSENPGPGQYVFALKTSDYDSASNTYVERSNVYTFNAADAGKNVDISYTRAALASYAPPAAPIYDLDDDDYLEYQGDNGSISGDPVAGVRKPPRQRANVVKVEYLDRSTDYNAALIRAYDDAAIRLYGERGNDQTKQWHWFCQASSALMAANLALGRDQIGNLYGVTVRPRFILLEPGDIVTITDVKLGLDRQWVRVVDVSENQDRSINLLLEEYLFGTAAAPVYGEQANTGNRPNYNADPGAINPPIIFEPTAEQLGALSLQIWAAVSGVETALYGGCDVYVSDDPNGDYVFVERQYGAARMGALTAELPAVTANPTGQTIDDQNTLAVDVSESAAELAPGTLADALALNTACYVGGEVVAYQNANLTGVGQYDLSYLVRGGYGTEGKIAAHPVGTDFCRLDDRLIQMPFDQTRIGSTVYFKFVPFNVWGGGGKTIADVDPYAYKITGAALASPLPTPGNRRTVFEAGFMKLWWDEVTDFRSDIRYQIRKGDTFQGAQQLGDLAHPPFIIFGNGTYWITAYCQPAPGLLVYSEDPASITVQGNMLVASLVTTINFQALGWPGTFDHVGKEGAAPNQFLRLSGADNILDTADVLAVPDILNAGGIAMEGVWEAAASTVIDIGYVAQANVNASWKSTGVPVGQNVLSIEDFLNNPDILAAASAAFASAYIEIATAIESHDDVFEPADIFAEGDAFRTGVQWGAWQRFVPGVYPARFLKFRAKLSTVDPKVIAYLLSLLVEVSVPARIDHYQGLTVPIEGLTVTFEPDNAETPAPFNGGPADNDLPYVNASWPNQAGDQFVIDELTEDHITFHVENGGVAVQRSNFNLSAEGY